MPVEPDERQFAEVAAVAGGDADGPVVMLNLNRARSHRLEGLERAALICCESADYAGVLSSELQR